MNRQKIKVIATIIFNNRLKLYKRYLEKAIKMGYIIDTMSEFYDSYEDDYKHLVLRHDVDHKNSSTRAMYELEKSLGVKSTYYFRISTIDTELIKEMVNNGFEVGLHYETIGYFYENKGVRDKKDLDLIECQNRLKKEIDEFRKTTGVKISSICSHGDKANRELGISNNWIVENSIPENFEIVFEAYDKDMYNYVDCHIMDDSLLRNYGFAYQENPNTAINKYNKIVFLTHPNHWQLSIRERLAMLKNIVKGNITNSTNRTFKRVAM